MNESIEVTFNKAGNTIMNNTPLKTLRYHVTGAIERGEKVAIVGQPIAKHTPGPWIAKEQYRDCVTNDVGHFVMWQDKSKPGVMLRRLDDKRGAFSAADARLIAAAPELLAALESLVALIRNQDVTIDRPGQDVDAALAPARAAIAKALAS